MSDLHSDNERVANFAMPVSVGEIQSSARATARQRRCTPDVMGAVEYHG
jgi:hypothetical protein